MSIKTCLHHAVVLSVLFVIMVLGFACTKEEPPPPPPPTWQDKVKEGWSATTNFVVEHKKEIAAGAAITAATFLHLSLDPGKVESRPNGVPEGYRQIGCEDPDQWRRELPYGVGRAIMDAFADDQPHKGGPPRRDVVKPAGTEGSISVVAVVLVVLIAISVVIMLIKHVEPVAKPPVARAPSLLQQGRDGLATPCIPGSATPSVSKKPSKLIKFISLGLAYLPRKLWKEKLFIPALWASIFKIPWLLQVKKFRRPDIWWSNIPRGLFFINIILWLFDVSLCVLCLCGNLRVLVFLVPALILTHYLYVGVYWARITIVAILVLWCIISIPKGGEFVFSCCASVGLIILLFLPKSNAWFRSQNGDVSA